MEIGKHIVQSKITSDGYHPRCAAFMERLGRSVDSDVCAPKPLGKFVPRHRYPRRQRDEKHPGENVDQYALRISSLFTRLLTEAARTRPIEKSSHTFAWERLKIAVFENGLLPAIRLEQIREDPAHSFAAARDRARKHASNNLHGVNVSNLSSVARTSPALKTQLETRLDDVQATIASIIDAPTPPRKQRGRSKSERPATQGRRDNSTSRAKSNGKKASRTTRPTTCTFQHCMRPTTHRTEDCLFKKLAEKIGSDP